MHKFNINTVVVGFLILVISIIVSTKSYAEFDVLLDDVDATLENHHYKVNERYTTYSPSGVDYVASDSDNDLAKQIFMCRGRGVAYGKFIDLGNNTYLPYLTEAERGPYRIKGSDPTIIYTDWQDVDYNLPSIESDLPLTVYSDGRITTDGRRVAMHYKSIGTVDEQDFHYALATMKAKGYGIASEFFKDKDAREAQETVWGTSVNTGDEVGKTKLAEEATAYKEFYKLKEEQKQLDPENPINLQDETEYSDEEGNKKPSVAVDTVNNTYTVGTLKFSYLEGNYEAEADTETVVDWSPEQSVDYYHKYLKDMVETTKPIYDYICESCSLYVEPLSWRDLEFNREYWESHGIVVPSVPDGVYWNKHTYPPKFYPESRVTKREGRSYNVTTGEDEEYEYFVAVGYGDKRMFKSQEALVLFGECWKDVEKLTNDYYRWYYREHTSEGITILKEKIEDLQNATCNLEIGSFADSWYSRYWAKEASEFSEIITRIAADIPSDADAAGNIETKFSYVNSITVIGIDKNGNEREIATNSVEDDTKLTILDKDKNILQGKVFEDNEAEQTGVLSERTYNIPQSGDEFYVQFKLDEKDKDIKGVKIKVSIRYLDYCDVKAYKYEGKLYFWKWEVDMTNAPYCSHQYCDTPGLNGIGCVHYSNYKKKRGKITISSTDISTQPLVGVLKNYFYNKAQKIWREKDILVQFNGDEPIPIAMDIGGYVFLDQDQGKVNTGNNVLDFNNDEGLPDTEVWLYEYTEDNKEGTFVDITLTDQKGHYYFDGLDVDKKYYVKFIYNGILYDDIEYTGEYEKYRIDNVMYNSEDWKITSKAQDVGRQEFNQKFAEIGSYPSNYKIIDKIFGNDLGEYNKVYLQEDIVTLFKEISKEVVKEKGNVQKACKKVAQAHRNDPEIKNKVQFAADCRMVACTNREKIHINGGDDGEYNIYPVYAKFTTTSYTPIEMLGVTYKPIYVGQTYINFGIKARPTVDLALYKDVIKAEVSINGKTEAYTYNWLDDIDGKGFAVGVNEEDYLKGLRGAYRNGTTYTNETKVRDIETDSYTTNVRKEEITNGASFNDSVNANSNMELINGYNIEDKLNIDLIYKISVINQSSTIARATEIVDYYDNGFEFVEAYIGDETGKRLEGEAGNVELRDTTKFAGQNSEYKSIKNTYKTMYLQTPSTIRLENGKEQYVYVKLRLKGKNQAGELLQEILTNDKKSITMLNIAEINGYKTYSRLDSQENDNLGLIDIDSNPGNLNISNIDALNQENIVNYPNIRQMYEDDTRRAPTMVYKLYESRSLYGTVFEDNTGWNNQTIHTKEERKANGQLDNGETRIKDVQVDLVEIRNDGQIITRASTLTDANGAYSFSEFLPGDYGIRYIYGANDKTALSTESKWYKGSNRKSYNGQDFQSTTYKEKTEKYWYTDADTPTNPNLSDAKDVSSRVNEVIEYSTKANNVEITNHKAEVFKSYEKEQAEHITQSYNRELINELEEKTFRYAYTPTIEVEIEYATKEIKGGQADEKYKYQIKGIDFGIVERPRSELVIDQDIERIKVTASDGITVLFDAKASMSNLQWIKGRNDSSRYYGAKIEGAEKTAYTVGELANVILDEELMNGAKIEITYRFVVTNNGENDTRTSGGTVAKTAAKTIINYVANNLDFDASINPKWKIVSAQDIQNATPATYVNNTEGRDGLKLIDLSTQSTIIQATSNNELTKLLAPGEQATETLTLSKVIATESSADTLSYSNIAEIVEIQNEVGRYDRGATPGNQDISDMPQEHDATGVGEEGIIDATIIITPPTGSKYIYYAIGITGLTILAAGIILIKKFVIDKGN